MLGDLNSDISMPDFSGAIDPNTNDVTGGNLFGDGSSINWTPGGNPFSNLDWSNAGSSTGTGNNLGSTVVAQVPGLISTAEKILTTAFGVPQVNPNQSLQMNADGSYSTVRLGVNQPGPGGSLSLGTGSGSILSGYLPLILLGGLGLLLLTKKH